MNWGEILSPCLLISVVQLNPVQSPLLWFCIPTLGRFPFVPSNRRWNVTASPVLCFDRSRDSPVRRRRVFQSCGDKIKAIHSLMVCFWVFFVSFFLLLFFVDPRSLDLTQVTHKRQGNVTKVCLHLFIYLIFG